MPQRIRLSRAKGWRKPAGAIVVTRPTKWGNPYKVGESVHVGPAWAGRDTIVRDRAHAVELYRAWLFNQRRADYLIPELAGHDLCCWCPLDQPCHADVLLDIANQGGVS
jgi:hypothetical protein